jgi:uncharacterized protein YjbJ (UPF0337 family)
VDKNRAEGQGKQIKGKVREGVGKVTGNDEQIARGKVEQGEGKFQNKVGKVKDEVRKRI